ncbi:MAG: bifunctional alpha,alpha-trehalose-phosphate synthase (UDP-forming)/trehalose-phosphatase [Anaerolineaceae bacterium]
MSRPLLVSNRLPVSLSDSPEPEVCVSNGGLVSGLLGPWRRSGGLWLGHAEPDLIAALSDGQLTSQIPVDQLVPVAVDADTHHGYYAGISNGLLWPVFHDRMDQVAFEPGDWGRYVAVNRAFADAVIAMSDSDDTIWVHDYHLCLLPQMIRERRPDARIGFFLHVPFPSPETFSTIPWREEVLSGITGADYVGFHAPRYLSNFAAACNRFGVGLVGLDGVTVRDRTAALGVLPLGVDAASWSVDSDSLHAETEAIRAQLGEQRLLLGVDRLDYSKGFPRRLEAIDALLESRPDLIGNIRFVQVGAPSRGEVKAYASYQRAVQELVGKINGKWATGSWMPIHNVERMLQRPEITALYRAADVMVVTPLRDGLNLVAKEFVASRTDEDGVLVLSEFAGAATELAGAVEVNPFDITGTAVALGRALDMPQAERRARMQTLRRRVMSSDADTWFGAFLKNVDRSVQSRHERPAHSVTVQAFGAKCAMHANLRLLLDYDGTLVPFSSDPEQASPDADLLELLDTLGRAPALSVHIVTGRPRESIGRFLGHLPLTIHAEHGLWSRAAGGNSWQVNTSITNEWMGRVRELMEHFVTVVPGSLIEEKTASLAWHFRTAADSDHATLRSREVEDVLREIGSGSGLNVLRGNCVIEVRPRNLHKGLVSNLALRDLVDNELVIAAGDDVTDEDLFRNLPPGSLAIHVGHGSTSAHAAVADHRELRNLLWSLARTRMPARSLQATATS